jgi:hypothetical protein
MSNTRYRKFRRRRVSSSSSVSLRAKILSRGGGSRRHGTRGGGGGGTRRHHGPGPGLGPDARLIPPRTKKVRAFTKKDFHSGDGMLTTVWGPSMWHFLHTMSFNYPVSPTPEQKQHYMEFILNLRNILPCKYCRMNLNLLRCAREIRTFQVALYAGCAESI